MSTDHAILGIISFFPASGYDIKHEFEQGGAGWLWGLSFGSIYPRLEKLAAEGYIQTHDEQTGGRARKRYELTRKGWKELSRWLATPPSLPLPVGDELLLRMLFWGTGRPEDRQTLVQHLEERRARYKTSLTRFKEFDPTTSSLDEYGQMLYRYAEIRLSAELAWAEEVIAQLEGPPGKAIDPRGRYEKAASRRAEALGQTTPRSDGEEST